MWLLISGRSGVPRRAQAAQWGRQLRDSNNNGNDNSFGRPTAVCRRVGIRRTGKTGGVVVVFRESSGTGSNGFSRDDIETSEIRLSRGILVRRIEQLQCWTTRVERNEENKSSHVARLYVSAGRHSVVWSVASRTNELSRELFFYRSYETSFATHDVLNNIFFENRKTRFLLKCLKLTFRHILARVCCFYIRRNCQ